MIFMRPETKQVMLKECDKFGDSFSKEATVQGLSEVRQHPALPILPSLC